MKFDIESVFMNNRFQFSVYYQFHFLIIDFGGSRRKLVPSTASHYLVIIKRFHIKKENLEIAIFS